MHNTAGFTDPQPLPGGATWTAEYESIDEREDLAFYIVEHSEAGAFWAEVQVRGPEWIVSPGFREWLRDQLARIAATAAPNTSHEGVYKTRFRLEKEGRTVASMEAVYDGIFD
jgi:hypothetical protein